MKNTLTFLLPFLTFLNIACQNIISDTTIMEFEERYFDHESIESYKNNPNFIYDSDPNLSSNPIKIWWQNLWYDIKRFINRTTSPEMWKIMRFLLIAGIILLVVYHLSHTDNSGFLSKKDHTIPLPEVRYESGDLQSYEIESIISDLVKKGEYRMAIRWKYLKTIKNLNDTGYLEWNKKSTNNQFTSQIKDANMRKIFNDLTRIYEYTWYGKHELASVELYDKLSLQFDEFNQSFQLPA